MGLSFVLELMLALHLNKRVGHEHLAQILNRSNNMRLVLTETNQKLHKNVDQILKAPATPGEAHAWTKEERDRLKQIVKQVQSDQFQDAMIEVKGEYLYDAIRTRLKQAHSSLWDDDKDKTRLRLANIRAREKYAAKVKPKKDAERRKKLHTKTDGTPDRRHRGHKSRPTNDSINGAVPPPTRTRSSKNLSISGQSTKTSAEAANGKLPSSDTSNVRLKNDGTPDRRCKEN